jgi:hypothetical protein
MNLFSKGLTLLVLIILLLAPVTRGQSSLPVMGQDTVLVWKVANQEFASEFVVRIAKFLPDRYVEWEDDKTQGTIFITNNDILNAKGFVNAQFFVSGVDTKASNSTTLWLSQRMYRELKEKQRVKFDIDNVRSVLTLERSEQITVEINRSPVLLPVIKVADDRGSERWFLDSEENPLLIKHTLGKFVQTLTSITTNRSNTLRWIKGRKLENLPH